MKRIAILLMILTCGLSSCITTKSVKKQQYVATVELNESANKTAPMSYSDDLFDIQFEMGRTTMSFTITNKTDEPVYIDWDLSSLAINEKNMRVIHNGIVLKDRDKPQAKSVIAPHTRINDAITPAENISYYPGFYGGYYNVAAGWIYKDFIKTTCVKADNITEEYILSQKGMKFSFLLSFEYLGSPCHRIFDFTVTDITKL